MRMTSGSSRKAYFSALEKLCVSLPSEFSGGRFHEVLDDPDAEPEQVHRLLLCSGKVYYDLIERRAKKKLKNVAIVRVEQFYPFPKDQLQKVMDRYFHPERYIPKPDTTAVAADSASVALLDLGEALDEPAVTGGGPQFP